MARLITCSTPLRGDVATLRLHHFECHLVALAVYGGLCVDARIGEFTAGVISMKSEPPSAEYTAESGDGGESPEASNQAGREERQQPNPCQTREY